MTLAGRFAYTTLALQPSFSSTEQNRCLLYEGDISLRAPSPSIFEVHALTSLLALLMVPLLAPETMKSFLPLIL